MAERDTVVTPCLRLQQHNLAVGPRLLQHAAHALEAGAYICLLFSSTLAVSDTKYSPNTPQYPLIPPKHPLDILYMLPLSHGKRLY